MHPRGLASVCSRTARGPASPRSLARSSTRRKTMAEAKKADKAQKAPKAGPAVAAGKKQPAPAGKGGKGAPSAAPEAPAARPKVTGAGPPRLRERFRATVIPALMKERGYTNPFQVPRLRKIVINMGVGEGKENAKVLDFATADLQAITGQKPVVTRAKKSIANFKLRANAPIGCKVTLRGARMYEFMDRLAHVAVPRVRDFRGVAPKAFDVAGHQVVVLVHPPAREHVHGPVPARVDGMDVIMV